MFHHRWPAQLSFPWMTQRDITLDDLIWADLQHSDALPEIHPEVTQDRHLWPRLVNAFWAVFG